MRSGERGRARCVRCGSNARSDQRPIVSSPSREVKRTTSSIPRPRRPTEMSSCLNHLDASRRNEGDEAAQIVCFCRRGLILTRLSPRASSASRSVRHRHKCRSHKSVEYVLLDRHSCTSSHLVTWSSGHRCSIEPLNQLSNDDQMTRRPDD